MNKLINGRILAFRRPIRSRGRKGHRKEPIFELLQRFKAKLVKFDVTVNLLDYHKRES